MRSYASTDVPPPIDPGIVVPTYWVRPPAIPAATPGDHRFVWDLHETAPRSVDAEYPIAAIVHATPLAPQGVLVLPGRYTVRLTAGGRTFSQPLGVRMDPRVETSRAALRQQYAVGQITVAGMNRSYALYERARKRKDTRRAARYEHINAELTQLLDYTQSADAAPTAVARTAIARILESVGNDKLSTLELPAINEP